MSEPKFRVLDGEEKSTQQVEKELLDKDAESKAQEENNPAAEPEQKIEPEEETHQPQQVELNDESVLSYLKEKTGREINSYDDLIEVREKEIELDEDVRLFNEYKKTTGRSLSDYFESTKDYNSMPDDDLLRNYYSSTMDGLDNEDINYMLTSRFGSDELDDEVDMRNKNIKKKQEVAKAKEFFNQRKEQFNIPLELSGGLVSDEERESYEAFQQYKANEASRQEQMASQQEELQKRSEYFVNKTNELFTDNFEGFGFNVGEEKVSYNPGDLNQIKQDNSSFEKFASKHLDEKGFIKDAEAYHKALTVANDPDAFFKFAYELGQANAVNDMAKTGKNVDMDLRNSQQTRSGNKPTARVMNPDSGNKLRIKK